MTEAPVSAIVTIAIAVLGGGGIFAFLSSVFRNRHERPKRDVDITETVQRITQEALESMDGRLKASEAEVARLRQELAHRVEDSATERAALRTEMQAQDERHTKERDQWAVQFSAMSRRIENVNTDNERLAVRIAELDSELSSTKRTLHRYEARTEQLALLVISMGGALPDWPDELPSRTE